MQLTRPVFATILIVYAMIPVVMVKFGIVASHM